MLQDGCWRTESRRRLMGQQMRWRVIRRTWIITAHYAERSPSLLLDAVDAKTFFISSCLCARDSPPPPHINFFSTMKWQHLHGHTRWMNITTEHVRTGMMKHSNIHSESTVFQFMFIVFSIFCPEFDFLWTSTEEIHCTGKHLESWICNFISSNLFTWQQQPSTSNISAASF